MKFFLDIIYEPSYSTQTIRIRDASNYDKVIVKNVTLEVTPPGFPKVSLPFTTKNINEYRASDLNLSCDSNEVNLPDGIYTFKYSIFPNQENFVKKSFMFTNNIVGEMQKKYLKLQLDCQCNNTFVNKEKGKLEEIQLFIEGSIAAANQCQDDLAYTLLRKAQELIRRVNCECGC